MARNDSRLAFPQALGAGENSGAYAGCEGMSMREYFAAAALPAVLQARVALGSDASQESIAEECFELADAMLGASAVQPEDESALVRAAAPEMLAALRLIAGQVHKFDPRWSIGGDLPRYCRFCGGSENRDHRADCPMVPAIAAIVKAEGA